MLCLSEAERKSILELARKAVEEAVYRKRLLAEIPKAGLFAERYGVFVTLRVRGRLRGCIGVIEASESLGERLVRSAASAAREDPRFKAMQAEELRELKIEISLLSPKQRILPEQVETGRHGLFLEQGMHRGLLLPQVAVDHKLSAEQFLRELCHKAGLAADAWKAPETRIYAFTCEIVRESTEGG